MKKGPTFEPSLALVSRGEKTAMSRQGIWSSLALVVTTVTIIGTALAQAPAEKKAAPAKAKGDEKAPPKAARIPPGAPPKKFRRPTVDPFVNVPNNQAGEENQTPAWPYHYKFKLISPDGVPLAAAYYPAQRGTAAVILLVHEKNRLGKDFDDPMADFKDKGFAQHLQSQGYAVLLLDLRGHGANQRKEIGSKENLGLVTDLQAAYQFLVDRHNREELNLAKLGVVALGEGANVTVAWAALPGGAVSSEGRTSDLGALVLVSPMVEGFGIHLEPTLAAVAPRIPLLLIAGERDAASLNPVKDAQPIVARQRQSKVEFFPTSLHGYKLLRYQPKVPEAILSFFEATIKKLRFEEWEPRYNLMPVAYSDIEVIPHKAAAGAKANAPKLASDANAAAEKDAKEAKKDEAKKAADKGADNATAKGKESPSAKKKVPSKKGSGS